MHWHEFPWKLDRIDCENRIHTIYVKEIQQHLYTTTKNKYVYSHFLSYTTW